MRKTLVLVVMGLFATGAVACVEEGDEEPDEVHEQGMQLYSEVNPETDVTGMKYTITPVKCPGDKKGAYNGESPEPIVAKETLKDMLLPGGIPTFENAPFDEDSQHQFADHLALLPVGCYDVEVQPMRSKHKYSKDCAAVSRPGVKVESGKTTEILLVSQCQGKETGLLDVIAALNHPPTMVDFEIIPNKFVQCEDPKEPVPVQICARATDPDGDPMIMDWSQLLGPNPKHQEVTHSVQVGDTLTECVQVDLRRLKEHDDEYRFKVSVFDQFHDDYGNLITAEQWYKQNSYGKIKSRVEQEFPIHLSCEKPPKKKRACPLDKGHWKDYNKYASMPNDIAWPTNSYTGDPAEKQKLCGKSWMKHLNTSPDGDAFYMLSHQYVAAHLNIANGAYLPPVVAAALFVSKGILKKCPTLKKPSLPRVIAKSMAVILKKYNNGYKTPKKCEEFPYGGND